MSAEHSDLARFARGARAAAYRVTRMRDADLWREDIEQDVLVRAWLLKTRENIDMGRDGFRYAAYDAADRYLGNHRDNGKARVHVSLEDVDLPSRTRDPAGPIAMWRLQKVWPTLTQTQQAGLFSCLVDDTYGATGEAAKAFGVSLYSISTARQAALERIDNPQAFKRKAKLGVRQMPEAERKAYQRAKQARHRAKKLAEVLP